MITLLWFFMILIQISSAPLIISLSGNARVKYLLL